MYRVCQCNTRVHAKCLKHTMQCVATHQETCAVCKTPYKIEFEYHPHIRPTHRVVVGAYVAFAGLSVSYGLLLVSVTLEHWKWALVALWVLSGTMLTLLHSRVTSASGSALCFAWHISGLRAH